ncbi:MAG: hypothetical protein AB2A00_22710 [Myxococcota bacterium]
MTAPRTTRRPPQAPRQHRLRASEDGTATPEAESEQRQLTAFAFMHPGHVKDLVEEPRHLLEETES